MKELKFVPLQKENEEHYKLLQSLMNPYNKELDEHPNRVIPDDCIVKITRGMLNMQGPSDHHLEVYYDGENLAGFVYGKVDHEGHKGFIKPGYGYIMEFYIKPEFRRKGYGKAMLKEIESLFASHGTKKMYLTADPVTGKPFWQAMGFQNTGERSPENGLLIFEKDVSYQNELSFVQLQKGDDELFNKAKSVWIPFIHEVNNNDGTVQSDDDIISGLQKRINIQGSRKNMHFEIALVKNEVIGIAMFSIDLGTVYGLLDSPGYGTIMGFYIKPECRRKGYGRKFYEHMQNVLEKDGAEKMYLCPDSVTGVPFWTAMGFQDSGKLGPDDRKTIYTKSIDRYTTVNATIESAEAVCDLYNRNIDALHGSSIPLDEWKNLLSVGDPDEEHFLIHKGAIPAAWLKINGLQDRDMAWISMLAVEPSMQRGGVGTYAVQFAENYIRLKGLSKVGIHTTGDNIPAQNLYCKC